MSKKVSLENSGNAGNTESIRGFGRKEAGNITEAPVLPRKYIPEELCKEYLLRAYDG